MALVARQTGQADARDLRSRSLGRGFRRAVLPRKREITGCIQANREDDHGWDISLDSVPREYRSYDEVYASALKSGKSVLAA